VRGRFRFRNRHLAGTAFAESLITHRMPLERTPDTFELVSNYRGGVGKMLIEC
jgi:hypothetical protein